MGPLVSAAEFEDEIRHIRAGIERTACNIRDEVRELEVRVKELELTGAERHRADKRIRTMCCCLDTAEQKQAAARLAAAKGQSLGRWLAELVLREIDKESSHGT